MSESTPTMIHKITQLEAVNRQQEIATQTRVANISQLHGQSQPCGHKLYRTGESDSVSSAWARVKPLKRKLFLFCVLAMATVSFQSFFKQKDLSSVSAVLRRQQFCECVPLKSHFANLKTNLRSSSAHCSLFSCRRSMFLQAKLNSTIGIIRQPMSADSSCSSRGQDHINCVFLSPSLLQASSGRQVSTSIDGKPLQEPRYFSRNLLQTTSGRQVFTSIGGKPPIIWLHQTSPKNDKIARSPHAKLGRPSSGNLRLKQAAECLMQFSTLQQSLTCPSSLASQIFLMQTSQQASSGRQVFTSIGDKPSIIWLHKIARSPHAKQADHPQATFGSSSCLVSHAT